jgi:hypothetical protein
MASVSLHVRSQSSYGKRLKKYVSFIEVIILMRYNMARRHETSGGVTNETLREYEMLHEDMAQTWV